MVWKTTQSVVVWRHDKAPSNQQGTFISVCAVPPSSHAQATSPGCPPSPTQVDSRTGPPPSNGDDQEPMAVPRPGESGLSLDDLKGPKEEVHEPLNIPDPSR